MKRIEISLLMALIFSFTLSVFTVNAESQQIRDSVLRLHVLANSDSDADQALKLMVRDRLLEAGGELYATAGSREEAIERTRENLPMLREEAEKTLRENGSDDEVTVALENTYFNTRTYGDVTLPAGEYTALRVIIGEGKGHNWWCVMFPPLCVSPVSGEEVRLDDVLDGAEMDFVEGAAYEPRFRCVELYEEWKQAWKERSGDAA